MKIMYNLTGTSLLAAKASQLHNVVSRDQELVEENKAKIETLQNERVNQIRDLQQVASYLSTLVGYTKKRCSICSERGPH